MITKEKLWEHELRRREKTFNKQKDKIIQENWFNVLLNTREYSRKKENNFKITHELIQFFNKQALNQYRGDVYLLKFIMEVDHDFKASRILAFTGCYKQAKSSLRNALENAFRIIYFKQHPNRLTSLNEDNLYSLGNANINDVTFRNIRLTNRIKQMKDTLSKSIHTSPQQLNPGMMVLSFRKEKYKEWLKDLNKVQKLILDMISEAV